jgi:hypothetical protein
MSSNMTAIQEHGKMHTPTGPFNEFAQTDRFSFDRLPEMTSTTGKSSWVAFLLFYLVLIVIITILDWANQLLTLRYWVAQVGLITLGVGIFAVIGLRLPDLSATRGVLLAFTVGILTIIPAVLMGLGDIPGFWPQYFSVALGMAAGSFLTFLFLRFAGKMSQPNSSTQGESENSE